MLKPYKRYFKEGHDSQSGNKSDIASIYAKLKIQSTNDMKNFKKPDFKKIDDIIDIFDGGDYYVVTIGRKSERQNVYQDKDILWYELA